MLNVAFKIANSNNKKLCHNEDENSEESWLSNY